MDAHDARPRTSGQHRVITQRIAVGGGGEFEAARLARLQQQLGASGLGQQQRGGAPVIAVAERRVAQRIGRDRAAEMADERRRNRLGLVLRGEDRFQRRAGFKRGALAKAAELRQRGRHAGLLAPGIERLLHRGLRLALRSAVAPQRGDGGVNSHRSAPAQIRPPPGWVS